MDAQLIHSLTAALAASPDNIALRLSVIRLHLDADRVDELNSLLAPLAPPRAHAGIRLDRELRHLDEPLHVAFDKAAE